MINDRGGANNENLFSNGEIYYYSLWTHKNDVGNLEIRKIKLERAEGKP